MPTAVAAKFAKQAEFKAAALCASVLVLLSACSSAPRVPERAPVAGTSLVRAAEQLIGTPYRYGGDDPRGFDCSGLVFYTHDRQGLEVPRTAAAQSRAASPVSLDALTPGDLVFFRISAREIDHVGIYAGNRRFIHAPRSGGVVSFAYLDDPYYRKHMRGAGRFWKP